MFLPVGRQVYVVKNQKKQLNPCLQPIKKAQKYRLEPRFLSKFLL